MSEGTSRGRAPTLSVAVVARDPALAELFERLLAGGDGRLAMEAVTDPAALAGRLRGARFDCVLCTHEGREEDDGPAADVRAADPDLPVVLVGWRPAEAVAHPLLEEPATTYVQLPADPADYDSLARALRRLVERHVDTRGGGAGADPAAAGARRDG